MPISAKIEYGCRALVELGLNWPKTVPVRLDYIARSQKIPVKFLTHILIQLKQLGYVESVRGKNGGYLLTRPPAEIRLSDVVQGFEGNHAAAGRSRPGSNTIIRDIWTEAEGAMMEQLAGITFGYIINRYRNKNKTLMFDI